MYENTCRSVFVGLMGAVLELVCYGQILVLAGGWVWAGYWF